MGETNLYSVTIRLAPKARRCKGCGRGMPITCVTGELAGYWHLGCLRRARTALTKSLEAHRGR